MATSTVTVVKTLKKLKTKNVLFGTFSMLKVGTTLLLHVIEHKQLAQYDFYAI